MRHDTTTHLARRIDREATITRRLERRVKYGTGR
jgi:hypothetical protein